MAACKELRVSQSFIWPNYTKMFLIDLKNPSEYHGKEKTEFSMIFNNELVVYSILNI
jgi:hypothetical protein